MDGKTTLERMLLVFQHLLSYNGEQAEFWTSDSNGYYESQATSFGFSDILEECIFSNTEPKGHGHYVRCVKE